MEKVITGNGAVAYGAKLARVQVIASYPISPQTTIVEYLAQFCATKQLDATFIPVESEHSALAACIGAATAGVRTFTATSSQGLALMHELLHWASGARLPIVMVNVNRGLAVPWNLLAEHTDSFSQRDTGWFQIYCENGQEVLDSILQAYYFAEKVCLPCIVNMEGFTLSYTSERVDIPQQDQVDAYLPAYYPPYELNPDRPGTFYQSITIPEKLCEMRRSVHQALAGALPIIKEADKKFYQLFGRRCGVVEQYRMEDAEIALVAAGTTAATARVAIDRLRERGARIGLLKIRLFRPLPVADIADSLRQVGKVAVLDRGISSGIGSILCQELKAALYNRDNRNLPIFGFMAGLGGVDVTPELISEIADYTSEHEYPDEEPIWMERR